MTNLTLIIPIILLFTAVGIVPAFAATPDAIPDSTITVNDRDILIDVLANDTDADGDDLYITGITSPEHGTSTTVVEVLDGLITFDRFVLGDVEKSDTIWYATNDHVDRDGYLYNEGTLIWEFEGHQIRSISVEPGENTVYVLTNLFDNEDNLGSIFRVDVNSGTAEEIVSGVSFLRAVFFNHIDGTVYYCKPSPNAGFFIVRDGISQKIAGPFEGVSDCDNGFVDKDGTIVFATHSQNSVKRFDGRTAVELFTIPQSGGTFSRVMDVQRDPVGNYYVAAPDIPAVVAVSADGIDQIDLITELRFPDRLAVDAKSIYVKTAGVSQLFFLFEYLEYMPDSGYTGFDSFTYTVTDETGHTDTATVGIQIEPDSDFDGLQDSLDVDPLPSPDFDNGHGWGTILSGQNSVIVTDEDIDGVRIFANDSVEVSICGGIETVTLGQLDEILVRCGSATVEVLQGIVEVVFIGDDGTTATATLTEGDNVTFNADTFTFVNDGENEVVISVDGDTIVLEPDSAKDNPCDALERAQQQGNGKKKGLEQAKQNNDCE